MSLGLNAIRAIVDNGSLELFRTLKPEWFVDTEEDIYKFVRSHVRRYGTLPSFDTLRENGHRLPSVREPAAYYVERLAQRAVYSAVSDRHAGFIEAMKSRDTAQIKQQLAEMLVATRQVDYRQDCSTLMEQLQGVIADYQEAKRRPGLQGVTLGNPVLDAVTNGGQAGDLIVIAGRPNIGKSWKLLSMLRGAWKAGHSVAVVSMEMPSRQLSRRLLGMESGLNPDMLRRGELSSNYGESAFYQTVERIGNLPPITFLEGSFRKTVADIDNLVQQCTPDILMVDAAYLVSPTSVNRNASVRDAKNTVLEELKSLAIDRRIPVVLSWQLNREAKRNGKKGLDLSHIAETDGLGQIASVVIGMLKGKVPLEASTREYQIIKNREGQLLSYHANFSFNPMNFDYIEGSEFEDGARPASTDEGEEGASEVDSNMTMENSGWEQ